MSNNKKMQKPVPNEVYLKYVGEVTPKTKQFRTLSIAFIVGGIICMVGQVIGDTIIHFYPEMQKEVLGSLVSAAMIFLGALLTGIGIYDQIGSFAGAGSIIPITGFANSIVSPALEFKSEGYVYGLAAKMFIIAGPIIVNGITLSAIVGFVYYFLPF